MTRPREPSCPLESLNHDVLVAILSAISLSLKDLYAFIQASPILFASFRDAKRTILLSSLMSELGPAIRDCIALSFIRKLNYEKQQYQRQAEKALDIYECLLTGGGSVTRGISVDEIVQIVRHNHDVQFFVDCYASSKFTYLERKPKETKWPCFTTSERQRLSQAIYRYQIWMHIYPGLGRTERDANILKKYVALYAPWELEQISEVHIFKHDIFWAMELSSPNTPERTPEWQYDLFKVRQVIRTLTTNQPDFSILMKNRLKVGGHLGGHLDLNFLHGTQHEDSGILPDATLMMEMPLLRNLAKGPIASLDELYKLEDDSTRLTAGDSLLDPPFAWVDAMEGRNCLRWGLHLMRTQPLDAVLAEEGYIFADLLLWKWLGFVFWDKNRIDIAKEGMGKFQTGWLTES